MSEAVRPRQQLVDTESRARASVYLLFAQLLREAPSASLLRDIVRRRPLTLAKQWGKETKSVDAVEDPRWPLQEQEIAVEYARLFVVPSEHAIRPYESVYCDTLSIDHSTACSVYYPPEPPAHRLCGFLQGPSSAAVREAYRQAGLEPDPAHPELPDHLATELEFVGRLLALGKAGQAKVFFTEHLDRAAHQEGRGAGASAGARPPVPPSTRHTGQHAEGWVLRCLAEISRKSDSEFYRAIADALGSFLRQERARLSSPSGEDPAARPRSAAAVSADQPPNTHRTRPWTGRRMSLGVDRALPRSRPGRNEPAAPGGPRPGELERRGGAATSGRPAPGCWPASSS